MGAKKKFKKSFGQTFVLTKTFFDVYWDLTTPRVTEVKIFFCQTDIHEVLNKCYYNQYLYFVQICLPQQLQKKVRKCLNLQVVLQYRASFISVLLSIKLNSNSIVDHILHFWDKLGQIWSKITQPRGQNENLIFLSQNI